MRLRNPFKRRPKETFTIAFYNVENLFDTRQDTNILDTDFIPTSDRKWDTKRYTHKLNRIAEAIASIGTNENKHPPIAIGLAEVENKTVLKDLLATEALAHLGYGFVHYNSPDERGIDTALIYRKKFITVTSSNSHQLYIETPEGSRDFTRDILEVECNFLGEHITFLINHWPSRRDGSNSTAYKRMEAAKRNVELLKERQSKSPEQQFIVMGDFNDDPHDESLKTLAKFGLYNAMETLLTHSEGTTKYKGTWNLFDQILMSYTFLKLDKKRLSYKSGAIYNPEFLKQQRGKYKGTPHRTYGGQKYTGGYSDHFPVYILLERN